ncbi:MAG: hypothetical protein AAGE84_04210 [Cyanobacteria bacterium P01_G01_bin.39]
MSKFSKKSIKLISQGQLNKMEAIIVDRWLETWTIVEKRDSARKNPDRCDDFYTSPICL